MKKLILVSCLLLVAAITIKAKEIFDAVKANDLAKVKALVEKDTSLVNLKDAAGNTPLHIAAITGSVPIAEYLLLKGADINAENTQLNTPLHESIRNKKDDISRMLIEKGCGLNNRDGIGRAPLHLAAEHNCKSIVELLIAKGADIESETDTKLTPLHYTVLMTNNYEIVEYLIQKGANVNTIDHFGNLPLNSAAYHRSLRMIDLLLDNNADIDTSGTHGINTLLSAAEKGSVRLFKAITAKIGDDYFKNEKYQESIMRSALSGGSLEIVNILLSKNIKINLSPDENGWTPLHFTASNK
jgi:ankyrin repeat protein